MTRGGGLLVTRVYMRINGILSFFSFSRSYFNCRSYGVIFTLGPLIKKTKPHAFFFSLIDKDSFFKNFSRRVFKEGKVQFNLIIRHY